MSKHWKAPAKGTRVVVFSADLGRSLGLGTYEGRFKHPVFKIKNPRILLDSGGHVWGCECWWTDRKEIAEAELAKEATHA